MKHDQTEPARLDDSDCDAASGGATPLMMGINRVVVTKSVEPGEVDEPGKGFCHPGYGSAAASDQVYPAAWEF